MNRCPRTTIQSIGVPIAGLLGSGLLTPVVASKPATSISEAIGVPRLAGFEPTAVASPPPDAAGLDRFATADDGTPLERQVVEVSLPTPPLRLAILPDRTTGRDWGLPYLAAAVEDLRRISPDAVFTIGDMVQGYTRSTDQWDLEADEWFEIASGLPTPAWPVAGNHDVVSGTRDPRDDTFEDRYRDRFGPLRYAVEFDRGTVVVAYSEGRRGEEGVAFAPEDLVWLEETLAHAASRDLPIVLLTHRPMWRYRSANWEEQVHPMLAEHGVDAVIAGHFHALQRDPDRDGVQYHVLGSCGGLIDQHPASGQLHHLTFLAISPEAAEGERVRIHHQLVGATLAADHVRREDQDRAWRLKRADDAARVVGAIAETDAATAAAGTLRLDLANPLDVPVRWSWQPLDAPPAPSPVEPLVPGGLAWSSMTPVDTFNPFTMRWDSPLSPAAGGPLELAPGERIAVDLPWTLEAHAGPLPPTELRLEATFLDSRGRSVPITAIRRVPVARERTLAVGETLTLPISAWVFSPYDLPEPDPSATLERHDDGSMTIVVAAPGDRLAEAVEDRRRDGDRLDDPMQDAIRIDLGEGEATRTVLLELLPDTAELRVFERRTNAEGETVLELVDEDRDVPSPRVVSGRWAPLGDGWSARIRLPGVLPPDTASATIQIGVADNDDTYHTQWRRLAPERHPLRIRAADPSSGSVRIAQ